MIGIEQRGIISEILTAKKVADKKSEEYSNIYDVAKVQVNILDSIFTAEAIEEEYEYLVS